MALRFIDGFDHATGLPELSGRWIVTGSPTLTATGGRFNSGHVRLSGNTASLARTLDNQQTWIIGFALRLPSASAYDTSTMIEFIDNTTTQCSFAINSSRQLRAYRGADATLLQTSSGTLAEERWYFIEIKLTIADTNGTYEVRVNGNTWINYTGDTKATSTTNHANTIRLSADTSRTILIDDLYICDGTGDTHNTFLGDSRVRTVFPVANGPVAFTPSGGTNHQNVDDPTPDDDTSHNESENPGDRDLFTFAPLTDVSRIHGVQVSTRARKTDAGVRDLRAVIQSGATLAFGTTVGLGTDYLTQSDVFPTDPATTAAWTPDAVNALLAGYEVVT